MTMTVKGCSCTYDYTMDMANIIAMDIAVAVIIDIVVAIATAGMIIHVIHRF